MDKAQHCYEPMDIDAEELCNGVEEFDADDDDPITRLPTYIPPRKGKAKVPKDPDLGKFPMITSCIARIICVAGTGTGSKTTMSKATTQKKK